MTEFNPNDQVFADTLWYYAKTQKVSIYQALANMVSMMDSFCGARPLSKDNAKALKYMLVNKFTEEERQKARMLYTVLWTEKATQDAIDTMLKTIKQ